MKKVQSYLILGLMLLFGASSALAQDKGDRPSPPKQTTAKMENGTVIIDYSSPGVKDRKIWGALVPYDAIWRTGANEATTITMDADMVIGGEEVPAGKYALFTIPGEEEWIVILNSEWDQWGAYNYDESKDVVRFTVVPEMVAENQENLVFVTEDDALVLAWEKLRLPIPVE